MNSIKIFCFGLSIMIMYLIDDFHPLSNSNRTFQGIAIYHSKVTTENNFNAIQLSEKQRKIISERMASILEKTYSLTFENNHSIYEEQKQTSQMQNQERPFLNSFGSSNSTYFKNIKDKRYNHQVDFYGKTFLIQDSLKLINWTLTSESKKIGKYTCYKAFASKSMDSKDFSDFKLGNIKSKDDENENKENDSSVITNAKPLIQIPETIDVVAWYTPDIPISTGPGEFWGLPGLILEVSSGKTTILCSQITLNIDDKIEIKEPKRGKKVSQYDYNKIVKEKQEEIRLKFQNGQRRGFNLNRFRQ